MCYRNRFLPREIHQFHAVCVNYLLQRTIYGLNEWDDTDFNRCVWLRERNLYQKNVFAPYSDTDRRRDGRSGQDDLRRRLLGGRTCWVYSPAHTSLVQHHNSFIASFKYQTSACTSRAIWKSDCSSHLQGSGIATFLVILNSCEIPSCPFVIYSSLMNL